MASIRSLAARMHGRRIQGAWNRRKQRKNVLQAHASASELLDEAKQLHAVEKRQAALAKFDAILAAKDVSPTVEERQEAAYSALSIVASYGDVEHAKSRVRDLHAEGLSLSAARQRPGYIALEAAPPVRKVLEKADQTATRTPAPSRARVQPTSSSSSSSSIDDGNPLKVDTAEGVDASVGAIILRVAAVLATMAVGFGVLFFLGLKSFQTS